MEDAGFKRTTSGIHSKIRPQLMEHLEAKG